MSLFAFRYCINFFTLETAQTVCQLLCYSLHGKRIFIELHCMKFHTLDMHIHLLEPKPALTLLLLYEIPYVKP